MSEFTLSKGFMLKLYSNKNSNVFKRAGEALIKDKEIIPDSTNIKVGIVYDDFNANSNISQRWKSEYPGIIIYSVAPRGKTLIMDDKVRFGKIMLEKMKRKEYMPPTYFNYQDIPSSTSETSIFFVKKAGSSAAKGVNAYYYRDMQNIDYSGSVIQQDLSNPDLIYDKDKNGYRYKIRAYVILKGGKVYLHKLTWASRANTKFAVDNDSNNTHLRRLCIVCQREGATFFLTDENIQNMDKVLASIRESAVELKLVFDKEIASIGNDEYSILGIDYVVDSDKNAQIIEINHRSNYEHPRETTDNVDIPVIKDVLALLANGVKGNEGIDGLEEI